MEEHKYIKLKDYNSFIIFPKIIEHSKFKYLNPISAGFCYLNENKLIAECYGESISLGIKSDSEDTKFLTRQIYGFDAMLNLE